MFRKKNLWHTPRVFLLIKKMFFVITYYQCN